MVQSVNLVILIIEIDSATAAAACGSKEGVLDHFASDNLVGDGQVDGMTLGRACVRLDLDPHGGRYGGNSYKYMQGER